jgi:hypothetical protein
MSLTFTFVFLFATSFSHIWAIIRQQFCYWGDHCTVHVVFCALRHIVVLLFVSFLEYFHYILLAAISVFYVIFFVVCVFLVLSSPVLLEKPTVAQLAKF